MSQGSPVGHQISLPLTGLKPVEDGYHQCLKCGALSGDDWSQCEGQCPVKGSPYFDARCLRVFEHIPDRGYTG